ncbi:serine hydrolase domain-containing protein [Longimicrobium sp.]|jgi:CubicO group peptidase (beta-lactamase class C family)|uniref:serine hydrolase domain-containing protein n=1 Tax=Longimicrobium sp. TaxID=2029185 RepID=UPI002EDA23B1
MKAMRGAALALAVAAAPAAAQAVDTAALGAAVAAELARTGMPGVAVVIVRGGEVEFARGYGVANVETGQAMTPDLLFQVGSVTKPFTAAAALTMVHDGRLELDAPAGRYVSDLASRIAPLTLRELLAQTTGLADESAEHGVHGEGTLVPYVQGWTGAEAVLERGEAFSYSNRNFTLAGALVEAASGKPYDEVVRERVLAPLGMRNATFRPTEAITQPVAQGHAARPGQPLAVVRPRADDTRQWPAGYLYASAPEVARLVIALLNRGRVDGRQAIPAAVVDSMLVARAAVPGLPNDARYGFGLFHDRIGGMASSWHSGTMPGFTAIFRVIPERRVGVVILGNREVRLDALAEAALSAAFREPLRSPATDVAAVAMSREELARYAGRYTGRFPLVLRMGNGGLLLERFGATLSVTPLGGGRFAVQAPGAPRPDVFTVVLPRDGRPGYLQMFLWAFPRDPAP